MDFLPLNTHKQLCTCNYVDTSYTTHTDTQGERDRHVPVVMGISPEPLPIGVIIDPPTHTASNMAAWHKLKTRVSISLKLMVLLLLVQYITAGCCAHDKFVSFSFGMKSETQSPKCGAQRLLTSHSYLQ